MPSRSRSSSTRRKRSAATRIQRRVRGKQTRKQHSRSIEQIYTNLEIARTCVICGERMLKNEPIARLECGHNFHANCLGRWFHNHDHKCPICIQHITSNDYENLRMPQPQPPPPPPDYHTMRRAHDIREHYRSEVTRLREEVDYVIDRLNSMPRPTSTIRPSQDPSTWILIRLNQVREELSRAEQNFEQARREVARLEGIPLPAGSSRTR